MPTIDDVRRFWDSSPLFAGESKHPVGSREFFEEHRDVVYSDVFAGRMDRPIYPPDFHRQRVLDLGCGTGFWLIEMWERGARDLTGADLSPRSLDLARRRCEMFNVAARTVVANAEDLPFPDGAFTHINCQGMVHATPDPAKACREIARVLAPGGTATILVHYRNLALRMWPAIRHAVRLFNLTIPGRGREAIIQLDNAADIVRYYDGAENPIGGMYSKRELKALIGPLEVVRWYYHFFPARTLPFRLPGFAHRALDQLSPFLFGVVVRKPLA
jgi:SAM-dependent methyltransferase